MPLVIVPKTSILICGNCSRTKVSPPINDINDGIFDTVVGRYLMEDDRSSLKYLQAQLPTDYPPLERTIKKRILQALNYIKNKNMKLNIPTIKQKVNKSTNYFLVLDNSGSMSYSIKDLKETIHAIKDMISAQDTVSLAYFSSYNDFSWIFKGASLHSMDISKLIDAKIYARGLTCFNQVMADLSKTVDDVVLLTSNDNCVFYFMSDGYPNDRSPESELFKLCSTVSSKFVTTNIIGYSNYYNRTVLLKMAELMGGTFTHVNNGREMKEANVEVFKSGKKVEIVPVERKYDMVWQVLGNEVRGLTQKSDNSVELLTENEAENTLYAVDMSELDTIEVTDPKFVYSWAYLLSQRNKANLGVSLLNRSGDTKSATMLRKAFTVAGKGVAENALKESMKSEVIPNTNAPNLLQLDTFLDNIENGSYFLDVGESIFNRITREGNYLNNVDFRTSNGNPRIVGIVRNENRPNISFQTVREGEITKILDEELKRRVDEYNIEAEKPITLPIKASTFKNYAFVANGDFNFTKLVVSEHDEKEAIAKLTIYPNEDIEIFKNSDEPIYAKDFVQKLKALIVAKAESSVLNFLIKEQADSVPAESDLRAIRYGSDAVEILKAMGLDSQMRYSSPQGSNVRADDADYLPFLSFKAYIAGASTINAKDAWKVIASGKKLNKPAEICQPVFTKYRDLEKSVKSDAYIGLLRDAVKTNKKLVGSISSNLSEIKFRMTTTNSWFEDVEKCDQFEMDEVVVKIAEEKEYL